jgi:hypothetical protein
MARQTLARYALVSGIVSLVLALIQAAKPTLVTRLFPGVTAFALYNVIIFILSVYTIVLFIMAKKKKLGDLKIAKYGLILGIISLIISVITIALSFTFFVFSLTGGKI